MNTRIQKWGNSLAVRLPKEVVRERNLHEGSTVNVSSENDRIVIRSVSKKPDTISLTDLVRDISPANTHSEVSWDESKGKEVW